MIRGSVDQMVGQAHDPVRGPKFGHFSSAWLMVVRGACPLPPTAWRAGRVLRWSCLGSAGVAPAAGASCGRLLAKATPALRLRQAAAAPAHAGKRIPTARWTRVDRVAPPGPPMSTRGTNRPRPVAQLQHRLRPAVRRVVLEWAFSSYPLRPAVRRPRACSPRTRWPTPKGSRLVIFIPPIRSTLKGSQRVLGRNGDPSEEGHKGLPVYRLTGRDSGRAFHYKSSAAARRLRAFRFYPSRGDRRDAISASVLEDDVVHEVVDEV